MRGTGSNAPGRGRSRCRALLDRLTLKQWLTLGALLWCILTPLYIWKRERVNLFIKARLLRMEVGCPAEEDRVAMAAMAVGQPQQQSATGGGASAAAAAAAAAAASVAASDLGPEFASVFPCNPAKLRIVRPTAGGGGFSSNTSSGTTPAAAPFSCPNLLATAFLDIGRSKWRYFPRTVGDYLDKMRDVLGLGNAMAVFVGYDMVEGVVQQRARHGLMDRTWVIGLPLECLPTAHLLDISVQALCRPDHYGLRLAETPEKVSAWYNLVMWAKPEFARAAALLPWPAHMDKGMDYVSWIDAGCHPPICDASLLTQGSCFRSRAKPAVLPDKLRICQLRPYTASDQATAVADWAAAQEVRFAGTIWGTGRAHIGRFADTFAATVRWMLTQGVSDQDQTIFAYMFAREPRDFHQYYATGADPWGDVGALY